MYSVLWLDTVVGPLAALTRAVGSTAAISAVLAERAATSTTTTEVSVAALDKVDLGIEDNHVAFLDAIADFHLRPQIPCHGYFSDVGVTTVDYGDLQAVAIENDRLGGHQKARCVMRNMKLDPAVGPGLHRAIWIRNVDIGQQRARARLQRMAIRASLCRRKCDRAALERERPQRTDNSRTKTGNLAAVGLTSLNPMRVAAWARRHSPIPVKPRKAGCELGPSMTVGCAGAANGQESGFP